MRTKISLPILCLCLGLSSSAFANDEHHPDKPKTPAPASLKQSDGINALKSDVIRLRLQVQKIAKAKDDQERKRLVTEYMHTLHESMQTAESLVGGVEGCPMMDEMSESMPSDGHHEHHMEMMKRMTGSDKH